MPETNHNGTYELSKRAGVVISAASIVLCTGLFVPTVYFWFPALLPDFQMSPPPVATAMSDKPHPEERDGGHPDKRRR